MCSPIHRSIKGTHLLRVYIPHPHMNQQWSNPWPRQRFATFQRIQKPERVNCSFYYSTVFFCNKNTPEGQRSPSRGHHVFANELKNKPLRVIEKMAAIFWSSLYFNFQNKFDAFCSLHTRWLSLTNSDYVCTAGVSCHEVPRAWPLFIDADLPAAWPDGLTATSFACHFANAIKYNWIDVG